MGSIKAFISLDLEAFLSYETELIYNQDSIPRSKQ